MSGCFLMHEYILNFSLNTIFSVTGKFLRFVLYIREGNELWLEHQEIK